MRTTPSKYNLAEGRHLLADLVQGRRAQARGVLGDDPHGHGLVLAGGVLVLGDDQHVGEDLALSDPRLLAVEEVGAVLLLPRHAGHRLVVGACAGLGEAEGEDRLARLQVVLHGVGDLLGRRAEVDEVAHREGVVEGAERGAGMVCELLGEESQGDEVRIDPAVLLGDAHQAEAALHPGGGELLAHPAVLVHLLNLVLAGIALAELLNALDEKLLLVSE